jgi:hypothetical protein
MGTTVFRIRIEPIFRRCGNLITPSRSCWGALRPMLGAEAIADVYKSESPAWGKRGFLMEKRRVGTERFMSRSTAADKGSTDNGAGSGPAPPQTKEAAN